MRRRLAILATALAHAACDANVVVLEHQTLLLPVEVLGPAGTTEIVRLPLASGAHARARTLRLALTGISGPHEAAIRMNDGPWVAIDNASVRPLGAAAALGGVGGPLSSLTVDVTLPAGALRPAQNRLAFRLERDDAGVGYRVRALDVLDTDGASEIIPGSVREDDPARWTVGDPAAAAEGERLWRTAALTEPGPAGPRPLRAGCADCHAADGRDLKYFGFSDRAIVAWSVRLGLSPRQGAAIASHVRGLPVTAWGRPWNPPYQPGPGVDGRPLERWAAGAGLDAVVEDDGETWRQIFPGGAVPRALNPRATLSAREVPLTWPLPDWNGWLPRIHPLDAWGDEFAAHAMNARYHALRAALSSATPPTAAACARALEAWGNEWREQLGEAKRRDPALASDPLRREKLASSSAWMVVKTWELMQEFGLEAAGAALYRDDGELRTWPGAWPAFDTRPSWDGSADLAALYAATAWRQLQLLVNPGTRHQTAHLPFDWFSYDDALRAFGAATGLEQASRAYVRVVKGLQSSDNGVGPDAPARGWSLNRASLLSLLANDASAPWRSLPPGRRRELIEAYLRPWLDKSESYAIETYARSARAGAASWEIEPADIVPDGTGGGVGNRLWRALPVAVELQVDAALMERLCALAARLWPRGDWAARCR